MTKELAERVLGKVPVPIETLPDGRVQLGPGYRALMNAWDLLVQEDA